MVGFLLLRPPEGTSPVTTLVSMAEGSCDILASVSRMCWAAAELGEIASSCSRSCRRPEAEEGGDGVRMEEERRCCS